MSESKDNVEWATLNTHKRISLTSGYIRCNYPKHIPTDIITLCYLFLNGDDFNEYYVGDERREFEMVPITNINQRNTVPDCETE